MCGSQYKKCGLSFSVFMEARIELGESRMQSLASLVWGL